MVNCNYSSQQVFNIIKPMKTGDVTVTTHWHFAVTKFRKLSFKRNEVCDWQGIVYTK